MSKDVYFRLKECEIGGGIMRGISFAANSMWSVLESRHARKTYMSANNARICGLNVRMIIIVAEGVDKQINKFDRKNHENGGDEREERLIIHALIEFGVDSLRRVQVMENDLVGADAIDQVE